MFPTLSQYNRTIQNQGADTFRTLSNLIFVPAKTLPIKIYSFGSGSFAVVFKALENNKEIAVRCFIGTDDDYVNRYKKIDTYLSNIDEPWKTNIKFLDSEIKVDGKYYPVLKMDWVAGKLLDKYINENLNNNNALTELQKQFVETSKSLEKNKIAHGDIQCGNIIIQEVYGKPIIKLIDYDGLYIPPFSGGKQTERGRSEFQHPNRPNFEFNEKIDRFSFWVILCALESLKLDKTLWQGVMQGGFNTTDNFLFEGNDFSNPNQSKLFYRLYNLNQSSLNFYLENLKLALNSSTIKELKLFNNEEKMGSKEKTTDEIESPIPINTPKVNEYKRLKIESNPSGAIVKDQNYITLGKTPLSLNKYKFLNEELKIIHLTKVKTKVVNESINEIFIDFETSANIGGFKAPIPPPPPLRSQKQTPPAQTPPKKEQHWILIVICILFFSGVMIYAIAQSNKNNSDIAPYDYNSAVDTTAVVVDTTAVFADTVGEAVDNTTFTPAENFTDSDKAPTVLTDEIIDAQAVATQSSNNIANNETYTIFEGKLRSEDNPLSDIIKYIPSGKTVMVIGRKGEYFKVYYDGYTGYLNEMYLKKTYNMSLLNENNNKNSSQPLSLANNSYQETYTIFEGKLRSEDNPVSDIIKYIPSGKTVRVIGRKGEYFKVYYDGNTGYLNKMYLKMTNTISSMKK
jgi:hypothetical protein